MTMIKALSIRQPYASLIIAGLKARETRDWATLYSGEVVIHAAKAWGRDEQADLRALMRFDQVRELFAPYLENGGKPPLGAALGVVTLTRCDRAEDIRAGLPELERAAGGYGDGRFAFLMENIRLFEHPIPMRGQLGMFDVVMPNVPLVARRTGAPPISAPKPAPAPRPKIDLDTPITLCWQDIHARNPYLHLLSGKRPPPDVIDLDWVRLVNRVFAWTNAVHEIELARQVHADAKAEWISTGKEFKHHLSTLRTREMRETADGSETSIALASQIARYEYDLKEHRKKKWNTTADARIAAALDRFSEVERDLRMLLEKESAR